VLLNYVIVEKPSVPKQMTTSKTETITLDQEKQEVHTNEELELGNVSQDCFKINKMKRGIY